MLSLAVTNSPTQEIAWRMRYCTNRVSEQIVISSHFYTTLPMIKCLSFVSFITSSERSVAEPILRPSEQHQRHKSYHSTRYSHSSTEQQSITLSDDNEVWLLHDHSTQRLVSRFDYATILYTDAKIWRLLKVCELRLETKVRLLLISRPLLLTLWIRRHWWRHFQTSRTMFLCRMIPFKLKLFPRNTRIMTQSMQKKLSDISFKRGFKNFQLTSQTTTRYQYMKSSMMKDTSLRLPSSSRNRICVS